jgi:hypothetical protein
VGERGKKELWLVFQRRQCTQLHVDNTQIISTISLSGSVKGSPLKSWLLLQKSYNVLRISPGKALPILLLTITIDKQIGFKCLSSRLLSNDSRTIFTQMQKHNK